MRTAALALLLAACGAHASHVEAPAPAPMPGSPAYAAMSDALAAYCADASQDCARLATDFAAGRTEWRDGAVVGHHGPGWLAIDLMEGAWMGATFRADGDAWTVVGIDSGDIK